MTRRLIVGTALATLALFAVPQAAGSGETQPSGEDVIAAASTPDSQPVIVERAPSSLTAAEMARISGGDVDASGVACAAAGSLAGGLTGNPGVGLFVGLACEHLADPPEAG